MPNLLLVEDEDFLADILEKKFKTVGFEVFRATNGSEGLAFLEKFVVDVALVDVVMPKMDGVEMIYQWKQRKGGNVPVYVMTNLESVAFPETVEKVFLKVNTTLDQMVTTIADRLGISVSNQ